MNEDCNAARRLIAGGPLCVVEECRCGVLHVTVGAFTIRLQREVVESIWNTVGEALACLAHPRREAPRGHGFMVPRTRAERPS